VFSEHWRTDLSNLLLGFANAAAPLRAEVMTRLLACVRAHLLGEGRTAASMEHASGNLLYALAALSNFWVCKWRRTQSRVSYGELRACSCLPRRATSRCVLAHREDAVHGLQLKLLQLMELCCVG
jgi:hypothetical protein